ncbi:calcium-activated potassium channel slowpoke-like, partial [Penaeus indicus]|uniref:calcium-activated potassium channel slowpoke-like n=1 Tax=Penaeus indicus TaxID=29960 RepID=UPI00300D7AAC
QLFENCLPLAENAFQMVDLALNVCFLGPFLLRMALAENVRKFLSSCYTIADYCTIPPAIFGVIIGRSFVGLQFMRSIFLLKVPEIGGSVEISRGFLIRKSLSKVLTVWFLMAGLMHLNEGLGDSTSLEEPHELTYGTWLYFTVVTLTTVGYGDITCKTTLCRCYLIISIVFTLVLYATYIPELVMRIGKLETNVMPYVPILARRHIVFCGFLDPQKIRSFVTRWIDRGVDLVFLGDCTPGKDVEDPFPSLLDLRPVQGLVQDGQQLVGIHEARACIFLSSQKNLDQEGEDFGNICSALCASRSTTSPVLLELLQCKSKKLFDELLQSRPERNLSVFCYAEFKLRLVGYSCLVPGFSTLLANLILPDMEKDMGNQTYELIWEKEYNFGRSSFIYTTRLSASFESLTLHEAVELCYKKLGLILLGIKTDEGKSSKIIVYPSNAYFVIPENTVGYFCTREIEILQRASLYCSLCSQDEEGLFDGPCKCDKTEKRKMKVKTQDFDKTSLCASGAGPARPLQTVDENFVGSSEKKFEEFIKTQDELKAFDLDGHVVVFVLANQDSPASGLENLCHPLRSNCVHPSHLHRIIIIGPLDYLRKEWVQLRGIPEIYFADGYPWAKETLEVVKLASCQMCVLLNAGPEKLDSHFNFAFEVLKVTSSQLVRTKNKAAMMFGGAPTVNGQCNFCKRLPVLVSHITDEPMTPANDTLAVAVGWTIPPALCLSFAYLNYDRSDILSFACTLLQGGLSPESLVKQSCVGYDQVQVRLLVPLDAKCETINNGGTYGELFCLALHNNMLCLGLYRELVESSEEPPLRYVITNPEDNFKVYSTDLMFVLCRRSKVKRSRFLP